MKILFIADGQNPDFQANMLFHGLRSLYGPDVVDYTRQWYMYCVHAHTIYSVCMDETGVDRDDIPGKIKKKYFDYIFYGSVHRDRSWLGEVAEAYPRDHIVFIDGEDHSCLANERHFGSWYFKRELANEEDKVFPIQFCFPKEKLVTPIPEKRMVMAPLIPGQLDTYIYPHEADYYRMYGESYFGRTRKKGGWDCNRHYEILGSGCLPYFENIEECPPLTMFRMPRTQLLQIRKMCDEWVGETNQYWDYLHGMREFLIKDMSTESMAKYVMETITK